MITAETTVFDLLERWPGVEAELIRLAPAMGGLRNPVLRDAVARSATLARVAGIAGIGAGELVDTLREAAGLSFEAEAPPSGGPAWALASRVKVEIDADEMLTRGVHPIGLVRESAAKLATGEVLRLTSGFRPEPLLESMRRSGMEVWCGEMAPGRFATWMTPADRG